MRARPRTALVAASAVLCGLALAPTSAMAVVSGDGGTSTPTTALAPSAPARYTGPAFVIGDSVLLGVGRTTLYQWKSGKVGPLLRSRVQ